MHRRDLQITKSTAILLKPGMYVGIRSIGSTHPPQPYVQGILKVTQEDTFSSHIYVTGTIEYSYPAAAIEGKEACYRHSDCYFLCSVNDLLSWYGDNISTFSSKVGLITHPEMAYINALVKTMNVEQAIAAAIAAGAYDDRI